MADLEKMYISQERVRDEGYGRGDDREDDREDGLTISFGPARKLQRINSQEELDFHETSSSSDYSELHSAESVGELEMDVARRTDQEQTYGRDYTPSPEDMMFLPRRTSQNKTRTASPQTIVSVRPNSKVTVPKPFQMMLREEERKRHKVRTRSEIELENTLLRRELEELQECQKKFRASPAPAHIHLPLYEVISQRFSQARSVRNTSRRNQGSPTAQPFTFLERERRKKEAKIEEELGRLGPKEERQVFKARPVPRSLYAAKQRSKSTSRHPKILNVCMLERGVTEGHSDPNSDPEQVSSPEPCRPQKCVKKQLEVSIELVKESERQLQHSAV
uniref:Protein FAM161A n=2 Tax=Takifugu rubripes TaxID=31033 RepID=A0A674MTH0_TAKRU